MREAQFGNTHLLLNTDIWFLSVKVNRNIARKFIFVAHLLQAKPFTYVMCCLILTFTGKMIDHTLQIINKVSKKLSNLSNVTQLINGKDGIQPHVYLTSKSRHLPYGQTANLCCLTQSTCSLMIQCESYMTHFSLYMKYQQKNEIVR